MKKMRFGIWGVSALLAILCASVNAKAYGKDAYGPESYEDYTEVILGMKEAQGKLVEGHNQRLKKLNADKVKNAEEIARVQRDMESRNTAIEYLDLAQETIDAVSDKKKEKLTAKDLDKALDEVKFKINAELKAAARDEGNPHPDKALIAFRLIDRIDDLARAFRKTRGGEIDLKDAKPKSAHGSKLFITDGVPDARLGKDKDRAMHLKLVGDAWLIDLYLKERGRWVLKEKDIVTDSVEKTPRTKSTDQKGKPGH